MSAPQGRGRSRGRARPPVSHNGPESLPTPGANSSRLLGNGSLVSSAGSSPLSGNSPILSGASSPVLGSPTAITQLCQQFQDVSVIKESAKVLAKEQSDFLRTVRAKRPGYGTAFIKKIALYANYFTLELPHGVVYQYDVNIVPQRPPRADGSIPKSAPPNRLPPSLTKHVFNELVSHNAVFAKHMPVYDGNKTLVTKYPLNIKQKNVFEVILREDGRESLFIVSVKPALTAHGEKGEVDLEPLHLYVKKRAGELPLDSLRVMDMIFRHGPAMNLVPVGRSFFIKPTRDEDLPPFGGGKEIWFGYTQSVRPTEWGHMLNLDLTATVFFKEGPLIDFFSQFLGYRLTNKTMDPIDIRKLVTEVRGVRVRTTHSSIPRKYTLAGVSKKNAKELEFRPDGDPNSRPVSIEQYFFQQYKYKLQYPLLPCLQVQPKTKNTYLPMEVCVMLPEQHCKRRLDPTQTANMIKKTCKSPQNRFQEIRKRLDQTHKLAGPYLEHYGIGLSKDLVEVESRVLKAPVVVYHQTQDAFQPKQGFWNIADHRFFRSVSIKHWLVMNYGNCRDNELKNFAEMLYREGNRLGMEFAPPMDIKNLKNERRLGAKEILNRSKKMFPDLQLVVLVIPSRTDQSNYSEIKKAGDTELGIVTQCIKDVTVSRKCNGSLMGNLCQKINVKMGGINNTVTPERPFKEPAIFQEPILVLGADVTHPSPDEHSPSVAAVVGSLDRYPSRFAARVKVQKSTLGGIQSRVELILELKDMVISLLKQFYKETRQKPQRLLFYRDGVSETQFPEVLHYEVNQIRQACKALNPDYKPALTFLCVQKRHRTRFCPKKLSDACGKAGNIPPGTTVDTGIVSPVDFDFFLCSHFGLQGTSRPTHYSVLLDESNMSADEVQSVTYALCHTYARCTRSLSIPVPVQYAHLAAFRARDHLKQVMDFSSGSSSEGSCNGEYGYERSHIIEEAVQVVQDLQNQMYFV